MKVLQGEDYPHFCPDCQATIDACVVVAEFGPDTDDPEAPLNLASDQGMLCGGEVCDKRADPNYVALAHFIMHG